MASLERDWAVTAGRTLSGGTDSYVAEVTQADGSPAVLKVIFPRDVPSARNEITVLRLAGGDGCVRLLRADERAATAIWEWGVVERMSTGLLCTQIGAQRRGRLLLAAADALAG